MYVMILKKRFLSMKKNSLKFRNFKQLQKYEINANPIVRKFENLILFNRVDLIYTKKKKKNVQNINKTILIRLKKKVFFA